MSTLITGTGLNPQRVRKRLAREGHKASHDAQNLRGLRAKLYQQNRHKEKIQMKKRIKAQEEKNVKSAAPEILMSTLKDPMQCNVRSSRFDPVILQNTIGQAITITMKSKSQHQR
ncbi:TGF-beta-inducible nuclear protein 1 [Penicillium digitatum]|uniref:TGF-beta-inducible nuclear protein 1 n=3 Tax=Penicillium digitatum TaxID=36651 RepID=K9G330_PEND2|nr:TGF-beta-inducible nuclear protein 1 [Penicillium digitatum Pd1]EKV10031.1 TGF-beta-inducible nuclear protein 1 [Penicillium digitatum Pd1]EKV15287.1 TGF-beta-inducible nuclear protein 1 [Penicillium digitatum PHI26]QQK44354.1 TGF-beta-inducible nuclear protein 1 [Penicillium digitatum]